MHGLPLLGVIVAGALCAVPQLGAQALSTSQQPVAPNLGRVHYDLSLGRPTKVVSPHAGGAGPGALAGGGAARGRVQTFRNTITSGYFTSGFVGPEFVDWATKTGGGQFTTAVVLGYATTAAGTSIGGPGASLVLNFYSGTTGFCSLGQPIAGLGFTGLPGRTAGIPPGFGAGYILTAFLAQNLYIPDGRFGWGYGFTAPTEGPLLTDFGTNTGWADAFDFWAAWPANTSTCTGTLFFGGCSTGNLPPPPTGTPCASFFLGLIDFVAQTTASCTFANGSGTNPTDLVVLAPPVLGGVFRATTALPVAGYALTAGPLAPVLLAGLIRGELLCDPTVLYGGFRFTTNGQIAIGVPKLAGLDGTPICVQAAEFLGPGNFRLTNRYDCVLGG